MTRTSRPFSPIGKKRRKRRKKEYKVIPTPFRDYLAVLHGVTDENKQSRD